MRVLVVMTDRRQELGDVVIVQPVVRMARVAANSHQSSLPKQAQLVGGGARREPGRLDELLHRSLAVEHRPQEPQSAPSAERAHRLGERLGLGDVQRLGGRTMLRRLWHSGQVRERMNRYPSFTLSGRTNVRRICS
jgi:hypothetical protein